MKIAILADIHGNLDALNAVLAQADDAGAQALFVCGDVVGYYYDSQKVFDLLRERRALMCRGNHEELLGVFLTDDTQKKEGITRKYGSSYNMTVEEMSGDDVHALINLPHPCETERDGVRFLLSHGAPWDLDQYIYPDAKDETLDQFSEYEDEYDVICTAHTHYPASWTRGKLQIVNPGSVGQPRSGEKGDASDTARAHWGLYDTQARFFQQMMTFYDPSRIFEDVERYDPHLSYLKDVLKRQEAAA